MVTTSQVLRFLTVRATEGSVVLLLIMFMPNIPPHTKIQDGTPVTATRPFEGKMQLNERLHKATIWHKGDLHGPEAFADYDGVLYASLQSGEIVRLAGEDVVPVIKFGKPCKGFYQERICGRPLGIQFDKDGSLIAADAYYGIFRVDVNTGEKIQLISPDDEIEGKKPKIPNSVAIASNGDIYWSDSSTDFLLEDGLIDMFTDGTGRLIHYDVKTKKNTVLLDNILFANGVALSADEEYVIVAETGRSCIHRVFLKGPNKGKKDKFIDGLPGLPDNIKSDGQGGFLVPLITARDDYTPLPMQVLGNFPSLRRLIARMFGLGELGLNLSQQVLPNEYAERLLHLIGHFSVLSYVLPSRVTILHLSKSGEIIDSLHANNRRILSISEAHIFNNELYLGSPFNDYIARVPLEKVGLEHLKNKPQPTPTEAPPTGAPETTTPMPKSAPAKPAETKPTPRPTPAPKPAATQPPQKPAATQPGQKPPAAQPAQKPTASQPAQKPPVAQPTPKPPAAKPSPKPPATKTKEEPPKTEPSKTAQPKQPQPSKQDPKPSSSQTKQEAPPSQHKVPK